MGKYVITGGSKLKGTVRINGAKNASLPILAASVLNNSTSEIKGVPKLKDVEVMLNILKLIGAEVKQEDTAFVIDSSKIDTCEVPEHLMRKMRSSIFLMGPLLGRFGYVKVSYPGGCEIGPRPIDLHIKGLKILGAEIEEKYGFIEAKAKKLVGNEIHLDFPSVGATENLMMAAVLADGLTSIRNAAKEPEIVDLQNFINAMGGKIKGAGTDTIRIIGVKELHPVSHSVIPDRIVAGTFLVAAAITGGNIYVENVILEHIEPTLAKLKEAGQLIKTFGDVVEIKGVLPPKSIDTLRTLPHPGFPTDMQAPMMSLMSIADGTTIITETVFENRFKHADELRRMGANIKVNGRIAVIRGVKSLSGAMVEAKDLRAGAALILAGLSAEGVTIVEGAQHVERGYENIDEKLRNLGADIRKVD
ncbi:MAG: UDP-N-acetylglucosamine 1-carboxyvinyltransferase [Thermosediminibacterales bacterium]|nr:UDP-N-acetylglucosamine 1-carboxyvinyltransferase [Thermosediminibacterales bacterium]